jgi:hypothetical protein
MADCDQGRYVTLHVPEQVEHAIKLSGLKSANGSQPFVEALPTHTQGFDQTPTGGLPKEGRSFERPAFRLSRLADRRLRARRRRAGELHRIYKCDLPSVEL